MNLSPDQVLAKWFLEEFGPTIQFPQGLYSIKQIPPILGHVFTNRYKLIIAKFDGTGNNPHDFKCMVIHVVEDRVSISPGTCESEPDF